MTVNSEALQQVLLGQADQIGARIGADPAQTQQAISAALHLPDAGAVESRSGPIASSAEASAAGVSASTA